MAATTRDRILDAALDTYLERGVVGASVEEVCSRSGASVGSVYHHFGSKQGLAEALYTEGMGRYQAAFLDELRRHDDPEAGLRAIVAFHLRWCRENRGLMRFLLARGEAPRGEALGERNREFFAAVMGWWRPHARYGGLRDLPLDLSYALWLGPAQEYCRLWLAGRAAVAPRVAEPVLADGAWHALKGD